MRHCNVDAPLTFFIRIFRLRNFFWLSQSAYTDDIE